MKQFRWDVWNFDGDGNAYIISTDICPEAKDVPDFICMADHLSERYKGKMIVEEGWCKFQVRSDFEDWVGQGKGLYIAMLYPHMTTAFKGKRGWFEVWIVRRGEWY